MSEKITTDSLVTSTSTLCINKRLVGRAFLVVSPKTICCGSTHRHTVSYYYGAGVNGRKKSAVLLENDRKKFSCFGKSGNF